MPCCASGTPEERAASQRSALVDNELKRSCREGGALKKLLLLGAGGSGKSTILRQLTHIHGKGFDTETLATHTSSMIGNVVSAMHALLEHCEYEDFSAEEASAAQHIERVEDETILSASEAADVAMLWQSHAVQTVFTQREKHSVHLPDGVSYLFDKIQLLASPGYVPTFEDLLRMRVRTTGVVETEFTVSRNHFIVYDVGGQRNERRKWIHVFEKAITAVMFVASISDYDVQLFEDADVNAFDEAVMLFEDVCRSRWFKKTPIILFLNKSDLFKEKMEVRKIPLQTSPMCASYQGGQSYQEGLDFLTGLFVERLNGRPQYIHATCAVDTESVRRVFDFTKDIIIRNSLVQAQIIP
ncbi:MAG: hypothetical protein MHM6MM_003574 [Cercozoa sp. M6MM]